MQYAELAFWSLSNAILAERAGFVCASDWTWSFAFEAIF